MTEEIWKQTYLSEDYEVSNFGRVRKYKTKKLLGRLFKVDHTTISKIITGKYWLHC